MGMTGGNYRWGDNRKSREKMHYVVAGVNREWGGGKKQKQHARWEGVA